jgi:uncharacterized LabA/DUF88 family protein
MTKVVAYVDGFNLYFGLRAKGWRKHYWLDVHALAQAYLKPGQSLGDTHYFTSRIRDNGHNAADRQRQNRYIDAITSRGTCVHEGHYLEKTRTCRACHTTWTDYEEKMTDVNIATQLLTDAYDGLFDVAFLVSGDSDLTTPLKRMRTKFPSKTFIVLFPPARQSSQLKQVAHGYLTISETNLKQSQLPDPVTLANGVTLARPPEWK